MNSQTLQTASRKKQVKVLMLCALMNRPGLPTPERKRRGHKLPAATNPPSAAIGDDEIRLHFVVKPIAIAPRPTILDVNEQKTPIAVDVASSATLQLHVETNPVHSTAWCDIPVDHPSFQANSSEDVWCLTVNAFGFEGHKDDSPFYALLLNGRYAKVKIDSGTRPNIMSEKQFRLLGGTPDMLGIPRIKLYPYMHNVALPVVGVARLPITDRGVARHADFFVAKGNGPPNSAG